MPQDFGAAQGDWLPPLKQQQQQQKHARPASAQPLLQQQSASSAEREAILEQVVRPWLNAPGAQWSTFQIDAATQSIRASLAKRSAACPWAGRVHSSNQLRVSIQRDGRVCISCWDSECRSHSQTRGLPDSLRRNLFPAAAAAASAAIDDDDAMASSGELSRDNDNLDYDINIEEEMLHEMQQLDDEDSQASSRRG